MSSAAQAKAKRKGYFGIEIGGTKLQVIVGNESLNIVERRRTTVDRVRAAAGIREQIGRAVSELREQFEPIAVGVGFGGPLDWKTGQIACSHHIGGWENFQLGEWVRSL